MNALLAIAILLQLRSNQRDASIAGATRSWSTSGPSTWIVRSGDEEHEAAVQPVEGGIEAAYRADLEAADDPDQLMADILQRLNKVRSPFRTAETFGVEEIIDPRDTRPLLCEFANLSAPLRRPGAFAHRMRP